jgi:hypothetical protein
MANRRPPWPFAALIIGATVAIVVLVLLSCFEVLCEEGLSCSRSKRPKCREMTKEMLHCHHKDPSDKNKPVRDTRAPAPRPGG